jgi:hypothetical protein
LYFRVSYSTSRNVPMSLPLISPRLNKYATVERSGYGLADDKHDGAHTHDKYRQAE